MKYCVQILFAVTCFLAATAAQAADAPADPFALLAKYTFGQSREPLAQIDAQVRKATAAEYQPLEAKLLAVLKSPQTTPDAKRYICRWLTLVGSAQCVPAVAELLTDAELSHPARMALEPQPDPAAGAALRAALSKAKGKVLAGLIGSIGVRRDALAIAELTRLAADSDGEIAGAAIAALGAIGTPEAVKALDGLPLAPAQSRSLGRAKLTAANHLRTAGQKAAASTIYKTLLQAQQPQATRVAALKGLVGALPAAEAAQLIVDLVQGSDVALRTAAVAAYIGETEKNLKAAVAEQLPSMKAAGQLILLGALADQADVPARPSVLKVLDAAGTDELRTAALECLVRHGEAADVPLVVRLAHAPSQPVAAAARNALERMGKPGVDEALAKLIESPNAADRAVVLAALANRRVESALPTLVRLVGGADATLATEAAKALQILGKAEHLTALATVLIKADNAELRGAAGEAVKAICSRTTDKPAAAKALLATFPQATTPAARSTLLPLLASTRGDEALNAVRQALQDSDADVREVAIRTLVAWPEATAAPHLIELAKAAQKPSYAVLALRDGCLRLAGQKDLAMSQRVSIYRSVLEAAKRPDEKKQAIAGLAEVPALSALETLQSCTKDESLRADASTATIRLARQLGTVYNKRALAALQELTAQTTNDDVRKQAAEAIKALQNAGQSPDGFILAWMVSGPYEDAGKSHTDLFDMAFAPEKAGANVEWRPITATPGNQSGLVELDKVFGGNNRVAYLRTEITSAQAQDALLLMGSDDGLKVWLNGQVVLADNATRPCTPDQNKAPIKLKQGGNVLLVKVTQGGGEWTACCRVRGADGKALDGVTIAPNEQ